jgi:hypothetical protein
MEEHEATTMRVMTTLRSLAAPTALALAFAAPIAAEAANFAGTWTFTGTFVYRGSSYVTAPVCVLRQSGNALAGSCKGPNAIGSASGTVNGRAFTLQWHAIANTGRTGVSTLKGTWGADGVVRGTITSTSAPGIGVLTGQKV